MGEAILNLPVSERPRGEVHRGTDKWLRGRVERGTLLAAFLIFAGYYLGARVGFALTFQPHPISVLWPPNSILLAVLSLTPPGKWWVLLAAAFPAHWLAQLQSDVPPAMILCWYVSNCFEALIGAGSIYYFCRGPLRFNSLRNLGIFLTFGALLAPLLSSFLDAAFVRMNGWGQEGYWFLFRMRFFSNVLTALTVVPFVVIAGSSRFSDLRNVPRSQFVEGVILTVCLLTVSGLVFLRKEVTAALAPTMFYAPAPFLFWATFRFGPGGASAAVLAVALLAIWGAAHGAGPFIGRVPEESALSVQLFLIGVSVTLMTLGVILNERRVADRKLRATEKLYREVVESQTDLLCRFLPDTTLTFVNGGFCRAFQQSRELLIGRKFLDFIRPEEHEGTVRTMSEVVKERRTTTRENEMLMPNGRCAWYQWTCFAVIDSDGEVKEVQASGYNITDRKRVEEIKQSLAHVSRLAVVGELTAMIAHEVNQPLGAILSNADAAEILLENDAPPLNEIRLILSEIRKDDLRASNAIVRIRALLRKRQMEMKLLDLNATVLEVIQLVTGDTLRRRVRIRTELAATVPHVMGDSVHIQQVLLNLAVNGMDAMAETPSGARCLTFRTSLRADGYVEIAVEDTGHGILRENLSRIFDSFVTTKSEGMGLGLSISRTIMEVHKGQIWAENNETGGAVFRVALPPVQGLS